MHTSKPFRASLDALETPVVPARCQRLGRTGTLEAIPTREALCLHSVTPSSLFQWALGILVTSVKAQCDPSRLQA